MLTPAEESASRQHIFYMPNYIVSLRGLSINGSTVSRPPSNLLLIVTDGSGQISMNGENHSLTAGTILCRSSMSGIHLSQKHQLQGIWIEYSSLPPGSSNSSPLNSGAPLSTSTPKAITLAAKLLNAWNTTDGSSPFFIQLLFTQLLDELYRRQDDPNPMPATWLDRVLQYIDNNYNEDLTRVQMADMAQISPEHFSRAFRKATGQTFNEYVTLLRIRRAQQRILTGAPTLTTLAQEVGYAEGTYLSRKFKQVVGISPAAYHRKNKRIVSLEFNPTASLRALEVMPRLGAYSSWMERHDCVPSEYKIKLKANTPAMLSSTLAAVRPDVILCYQLPEETKHLRPVAPVIELPYMQMDWREQFRLIAGIADRQLQAEEWLNRYEELCYSANRQLDKVLGLRGTAIVWELGAATAYCFSSNYGHGSQILYGDLGFEPPPLLVSEGLMSSGYLETSIENIPFYSADHIFITSGATTDEGRQRFAALLQSSRWREQKSVRSGQVYILEQPDMFYGFDPLSSLAQLKTLMEALTSQISIGRDHIQP